MAVQRWSKQEDHKFAPDMGNSVTQGDLSLKQQQQKNKMKKIKKRKEERKSKGKGKKNQHQNQSPSRLKCTLWFEKVSSEIHKKQLLAVNHANANLAFQLHKVIPIKPKTICKWQF